MKHNFQTSLFFDGFGQAGKQPYPGKFFPVLSCDWSFFPGNQPIINFSKF
jgi:hypothetical protein